MKIEPTVNVKDTSAGIGQFIADAARIAIGGNAKKVVSHQDLVADALDTFTKAEEKVQSAITQINQDIEDKEKQVAALQGGILGANKSKDKLTRIVDRIKAFTA